MKSKLNEEEVLILICPSCRATREGESSTTTHFCHLCQFPPVTMMMMSGVPRTQAEYWSMVGLAPEVVEMTPNHIIRSVAQWGVDKGLTDSNAQYVVMCEEVSELTTATSPEEILDGIGDVIVTAIVLHNQRSPDLDLTVREIREGIEKALTYKHLFVSRESLKSVVLHNARVIRKGTDEDVRKVMVAVVQETVFIAMKYDIDPMVALESVWNVIKDRTGKMVNNSFVKTEDLQ